MGLERRISFTNQKKNMWESPNQMTNVKNSINNVNIYHMYIYIYLRINSPFDLKPLCGLSFTQDAGWNPFPNMTLLPATADSLKLLHIHSMAWIAHIWSTFQLLDMDHEHDPLEKEMPSKSPWFHVKLGAFEAQSPSNCSRSCGTISKANSCEILFSNCYSNRNENPNPTNS